MCVCVCVCVCLFVLHHLAVTSKKKKTSVPFYRVLIIRITLSLTTLGRPTAVCHTTKLLYWSRGFATISVRHWPRRATSSYASSRDVTTYIYNKQIIRVTFTLSVEPLQLCPAVLITISTGARMLQLVILIRWLGSRKGQRWERTVWYGRGGMEMLGVG